MTNAELDAQVVAEAIEIGTKLRNGIALMRETFKKKYQRCTPDQGICSFPYVLDVDRHSVMVCTNMADKQCGGPRYVVVSCRASHNQEGAAYSARVNGNCFMESHIETLRDAMNSVEDVLYGYRW